MCADASSSYGSLVVAIVLTTQGVSEQVNISDYNTEGNFYMMQTFTEIQLPQKWKQ